MDRPRIGFADSGDDDDHFIQDKLYIEDPPTALGMT